MTSRNYLLSLVACGLTLLALAATGAVELRLWHHDMVMVIMFLSAALCALGAVLTLRHELQLDAKNQRRALLMILAVAILARALLVTAPPLSTDIYRYVWDGRVQAAGINPFRYMPADARLAFLRDGAIYPRINRADTAVTIYPPMAQLIFLGVTRLANSVTGMKAAMVAFEVLTVGALLALLRARGLPATRVIFYAWNPLPLFEFAGSGHIDAAAIALMMLACVLAERRQALSAGVLLGAAALVKFFPAVIAPALYRRWDWRLPAALAAVVVILYLPYLSVGKQVLGFLPGYMQDEGLASGTGFFALSALAHLTALPSWAVAAYLLAGGAVMGSLAWAVVLRRPWMVGSLAQSALLLPAAAAGRPAAASLARYSPWRVPMPAALLLMTVFTLWVSPHLAWYFTWLIPFTCFRPSWALMYLSAAAPLLYEIIWVPDSLTLHAALYVPFAALAAIELFKPAPTTPGVIG